MESQNNAISTGRGNRRGGEKTVVLVEDEASILKLATRGLERLGYRVLAAPAPQEALRMAAEQTAPIHLLITDVLLPEMPGRELAARLQSRHPSLQCLFISGHSAEDVVREGWVPADASFLPKPFRLAELQARVRELLGEELENTAG